MSRANDATMMYNEFNRLWLTRTPIDEREAVLEGIYRRKLTELAISRYEWKGMPESIDLRFLEHTLFYSNLALMFWDERYGMHLVARATPGGNFNMYDNPTWFQPFGTGFTGRKYSQTEAAPIWGNITRFGTDADIVNEYSKALAETDMTIRINMKSARRPKAIALDESEQLSVDNVIAQINRGDPVIKVTNSQFLDKIERTLDFGIDPTSIEKMSVLRARLMNECMSMLGINNANQDKKERLVAAEVDANAEQIDLGKRANLLSRLQAAEIINHHWPELNVSVDYASEDKEEEDGNVHDDDFGNVEDAASESGMGKGSE